jgi:hypothetical protein
MLLVTAFPSLWPAESAWKRSGNVAQQWSSSDPAFAYNPKGSLHSTTSERDQSAADFIAMTLKLFVGFAGTISFAALLSSAGCSNKGEPPALGSGDGGGGNTGANSICLRTNCGKDADCRDCDESKNVCLIAEKRCIACGPQAGNKTCTAGNYCTQHGDCVPNGVTCKVTGGVADATCSDDKGCAACDPKHRACDIPSKKCIGCTEANKTMCQSTDACVNGACVPKCPSSCKVDSDCSTCGSNGVNGAADTKHPACFRGRCADCNDTVTCPDAKKCDDHGSCQQSCGTSKLSRPDLGGGCYKDAECAGCTATGTTSCKPSLTGGQGECAINGNNPDGTPRGCKDLAGGVVKLPSPFDRVTATCGMGDNGDSPNNEDCSAASADINIIGLKLQYKMKKCAPIKVTSVKTACGVCVPCQEDSDCEPIDLLGIAGQALGPLGAIGAALLLDSVFGPNDKKIYMYCTKLFGDFGACVPCSNLLSKCGNGSRPQTTECVTTDICKSSSALSPATSCQQGCPAKVCKTQPQCCEEDSEWDQTCIDTAAKVCADKFDCESGFCGNKADGTYCTNGGSHGGFTCKEKTNVDNTQCGMTKFCRRKNPKDIFSLAVTNADGTATCFDTP